MTRGSQFENFRMIGSFMADNIKREVWIEISQLQIVIHQPGLKNFLKVMRSVNFKRSYSRGEFGSIIFTEYGKSFMKG